MVIIRTLFILLMLAPVAFADTNLFDDYLRFDEGFIIDGVTYTMAFNEQSDRVQISSPFNEFNLYNDSCQIVGYYQFCFYGFRNKQLYPPSTEAHITAVAKSCVLYNDSKGTELCKKAVYAECTYSSECLSKICLNGLCSYKRPICGDGYCDTLESCQSDCQVERFLIQDNPYTFEIEAGKGWYNSGFIFVPGVNYTFNLSAAIQLDWVSEPYGPSGKVELSAKSPCPKANIGAIVGRFCGRCIALNQTVQVTDECPLEVRINDHVMIDNSGIARVSILEDKAEEKFPAVKVKIDTTTTLESTTTSTTESAFNFLYATEEVDKPKVEKVIIVSAISVLFIGLILQLFRRRLRKRPPKETMEHIKQLREELMKIH